MTASVAGISIDLGQGPCLCPGNLYEAAIGVKDAGISVLLLYALGRSLIGYHLAMIPPREKHPGLFPKTEDRFSVQNMPL